MVKKTQVSVNMTGQYTPTNLVTESSQYSGGQAGWYAFDGKDNTFWKIAGYATPNGAYLIYDFSNNTIVNEYSVTSSVNTNQAPNSWVFQGSNSTSTGNSTDWIDLDARNNISYTESKTHTFSFKNNIPYKKYRFLVKGVVGATETSVEVAEIKLFRIDFEKRLALKNPTTNQHYSLAEKTLIPLPNTSSKNMILHGIGAGTEIQLDEAFDKIKYSLEKETATNENGLWVSKKINYKPTSIRITV